MGFVPLDDMPLAILHLHNRCNQSCAYCVANAEAHSDWGRIGDPAARRAVVRFFADHGPYQIVLNGGEPLITPGIFELVETLASQGHLIGVQSNLRTGAARFMQAVRPEQCSYILAGFHSVALHRLTPTLRVVEAMKARGYSIVVKLVLDEAMLAELPRVTDSFAAREIGVFLAPRVFFPKGRAAFPQTYSAAEWARIAPRMTMASSWLYFAGGWASRGRPCLAGQRLFHVRASTGTIDGCAHSFPRRLGDLYSNVLEPAREPAACGLEQCLCDFHTYIGVTPGLDESARFSKLLSGPAAPVPFDDYLAFVERAGITPSVDLRPVMTEAGIWDGEIAGALGVER